MSLHLGWPEYLYLISNLAGLAIMGRDYRRKELVPPMNPWAGLLMWVLISLPLVAWGGLFDAPCTHEDTEDPQ